MAIKDSKEIIRDFPKLQCPFVRESLKPGYICIDKINPSYEWVFEDKECFAVDKLDGTNVSLIIEKGILKQVFNRTNQKYPFNINKQTKWEGAFLEGFAGAVKRGWLKGKEDGQVFGELIGPNINTNRHKLDQHLFVPFDYLRTRCFWKSWSENKYPKDFKNISEWFKDLPSLFNQKLGLPKIQIEGLVFYGKNSNDEWKCAKLRRDMFDWFKGERH